MLQEDQVAPKRHKKKESVNARMEDEEVGILSDRVLGMPVAAAYSSTLPQNCCVQLCGKGGELTRNQRSLWLRCCFVAALGLIMLGVVSDALGSNMAVWQSSSRVSSQVRLGPASP